VRPVVVGSFRDLVPDVSIRRLRAVVRLVIGFPGHLSARRYSGGQFPRPISWAEVDGIRFRRHFKWLCNFAED